MNMAWDSEKFECPDPPNCTGNQMVSHTEWNAMVAYLKNKIRGMLFTAPIAGDDGKYIKYVHGTPGFVLSTPAGGGDMLKSVYDSGDNGIVDNSEKIDGCDAGIATGNVFKIPASIAHGDIFNVDASGHIIRLPAGTSGNFLKTQGPGANPIWAPGSNDVYGIDNFDGPSGVMITHSFGSTDYEFRIRPNTDGGGAIGEVWIDNLAANTVVVHNSGLGVSGFAWHLLGKGAGGGGGIDTWLELTDTPGAYTGQAGKYTKVNAGETALEFGTPLGGGDVVGPASSVNSRIALFDGVTGKLIKDAGKLLSNTANNIPVLDASADLPLAQIPATLIGKDADSVDGCDAGVVTGNVFKIPTGIAQGDVFFVNASGNIIRLAAGTNGHFLKTQGAAANPIWAAGAGGVTTWLALTDTPGAFDNGKIVKSGAAALSFGMLESDIFKKDGSVAATGDFLPDSTGIRKLGSVVKRWGDIHSDNHNIYSTLYGGFKVGQDLLPNADETHILGSATYKWDIIWARTVDFNSVCTDLINRMSAGDYINFTDGIEFNGAAGRSIINITHLLPKTTGASDLGSSTLKFRNIYTGNIIAWDGLSGGIKCEQDWLPFTTNTYDLGSVSYYWKNLFLQGYIDLKGTLYTSIIAEQPGGAGVTIDSCLIKDGTAAHTEVTKTSEITFATTDQSAGKAFTITDFIKHGMIKKVKFRANMTAGQLSTVSALVNDGTGLAPADTSLAFDGKSGTFTNGDYLSIANEIVKINDADPNTSPIVIVRAQKGTTASYLDDDAQITKLNNGFKLQLFKDSNKKPKEMVLELSTLMTAVGTTDAAISASDKKIELSADLKNVDNNDTVRIADTTSEEALVQHNTGDGAAAAYDFVLYVYDVLAAHNTAKTVEKVCVYDIPIPYKSDGTTLYGQIQLEEASLAANKTLNIELIIDKYS